ncbi:MAG: long-chain fatty acid--CoA ligase, partial [Alphaproteobacteria bacterium]|nr:long-chain fatty acid--CoA ligase [Alphaproteobacteria bacterium]
ATVHIIGPGWRESLAIGRGDKRSDGNPDEDFYLSFTSGSTGASKAIVTTRRQWQARYCTARKLFPFLLASERLPQLLVVGGLAFSAFFFFLANHLFAGGRVVLMTGAHDPDRLADAINRWDDAATLITPPLAREFLARAPEGGVMFPKMRALFIGAAPFFAEEKRAARARLTGHCYEVYGSAASGFLACLSPRDIDAHPDTVGRPAEDVEIDIVDKEGSRVAPGRTGHIRVRGPGISAGFFGQSANAPVGGEGFDGGWYYPGDLGAIDADGYLRLKGRLADLILRRGVEIYPPDLEEVFLAHPSIGEAAVVGARPPGGGADPEIVAFVVPRAAIEPQELVLHCRRWIAPERFPDRSVALPQLPKTGNGKVDRPRLAAMAEQVLRNAARSGGSGAAIGS